MSTIELTTPAPLEPAGGRRTYLNISYAVKSWLLTKDHKLLELARRAKGFRILHPRKFSIP